MREYGGKLSTYSNLIKYKKSDTLFILGSGQSINNLTSEHFNEIQSWDSIGINGFIRHEFKPTYMSFEWIACPQNQEEIDGNKDVFNILLKEYKKFDSTCFILRPSPVIYPHITNLIDDQLRKVVKQFKNIYWNLFDNIFGSKFDEYANYLFWYRKIGLFNKNDFFPNKDSSLSWTIGFAHKLGYKNVVLCGIDLYGFHFYTNPNQLTEKQFKNSDNQLHLTNDSSAVPVTVPDLVLLWKNKMGLNISVGSEYSLLSGILPKYHYIHLKK
jgi:hypothetical protein